MWILRNGVNIRVDLDVDPSWNNNDIWTARNLYARFKIMGYSNEDCASYSKASVWKQKWKGTIYSNEVEKTLSNISLNTVSNIPISS